MSIPVTERIDAKSGPAARAPDVQPDNADTLLRMIFGLSTNFISLPPEDVDDGITDVLKAIGSYARVDKSAVFQFADNCERIDRTHVWSANGNGNGNGSAHDYMPGQKFPWLSGRIKNCEVVHVPDVSRLPTEAAWEKKAFLAAGLRSVVAVPIVSGYSVMGFIEFESLHDHKAWSENIISLLKIVGEIFAFALSRKRINEALKESESKYRMLFEHANDAIFIIRDGRFVECNPKGLTMFGCSREQIVGRSPLQFCPPNQPDGTGSREMLFQKGNLALSGVPQTFEWKHLRYDGALFDAEISFNRVALGKDVFLQAMVRDVTDRKQAKEKLARTLKTLQKAMDGTIQAMVHMVEIRDPYTAGHQRRVADLAAEIAVEMNVPPNMVEGIRVAAIIHDVGKISVPFEILSKPGKLSPREFELIKDHPQTGYEVLKDVEFPWPIAQIIHQHHEKIDGSGYPLGLKGDNILLEARIITVADVIEAIASHRPYRPSRGIDAALSEIEQNKGRLYDASAVEACLRLFKEKGYKLL